MFKFAHWSSVGPLKNLLGSTKVNHIYCVVFSQCEISPNKNSIDLCRATVFWLLNIYFGECDVDIICITLYQIVVILYIYHCYWLLSYIWNIILYNFGCTVEVEQCLFSIFFYQIPLFWMLIQCAFYNSCVSFSRVNNS